MKRWNEWLRKERRKLLLAASWQRIRTHLRGLDADWRGLKLLAASAPLLVTGSLALRVLFSVVPVLQVWLMKQLIDLLSASLPLAGKHAGTLDGTLLILLAVLYLLTLVLPEGLLPVEVSLSAAIGERVVAEIDRRVMRAAARLVDLQRLEAASFHDEVKLIQQCSHDAALLLPNLSSGPGSMLTLGGLLLLVGQIHSVLPLVLLLVGIPYLRALHHMEGEKYRSMAEYTRVAREMEYYTRLSLETTVAHEVRVFGLGDFLLQRFRERRGKAMAEVQRLRVREFVQALAFSGVMALVLAGAFLYTALQASAGHLQVGDIALYLGAVGQAQEAVLGFGSWFAYLSRVQLQMCGLFDFLDGAQPAIALPPEGQGSLVPTLFKEGVELKEVHFHYPGRSQDAPVLQGVDARLSAGKVTALVGVNGAGKSTLVKLLTRMYDPTGGQILLDGASLASYELASLRSRMGLLGPPVKYTTLSFYEK